jgi:[ribosomal protein S18]-alanine N-acetyltransferase
MKRRQANGHAGGQGSASRGGRATVAQGEWRRYAPAMDRAAFGIRLAASGHANEVAVMSRDQIERGLPWQWTAERVRQSIRDRNTNVVIASGDDGALLGFGIMHYTDEEAHLLLLGVGPRHRRRGIGASLVEWLEAVARTAGLTRVQLECRRDNEAARNFYGALGYHEQAIVRRMYSGIEDGIALEKCITVPMVADDGS